MDITGTPEFAFDAAEACPLPSVDDAPEAPALVEHLAQVTRVAVVGASPRASRTSHHVTTWLVDNSHFEIYLVNPAAIGEEIRGHGFYASLAELPVTPDLVCVFRRAEFIPEIAQDVLSVGAGGMWLQSGIVSPESIAKVRDAGLFAVQNRCLKVEYARHAAAIEAQRS